MTEYIVTDRTTGLPVEIYIADGIIAYDSSIGVPSSEPVLMDRVTLAFYTLFIDDGIMGLEVTTGPEDMIRLTDTVTGTIFRLYVEDGTIAAVQSVEVTDVNIPQITHF